MLKGRNFITVLAFHLEVQLSTLLNFSDFSITITKKLQYLIYPLLLNLALLCFLIKQPLQHCLLARGKGSIDWSLSSFLHCRHFIGVVYSAENVIVHSAEKNSFLCCRRFVRCFAIGNWSKFTKSSSRKSKFGQFFTIRSISWANIVNVIAKVTKYYVGRRSRHVLFRREQGAFLCLKSTQTLSKRFFVATLTNETILSR